MRCRYCGKITPTLGTEPAIGRVRLCARCGWLKGERLLSRQGDGVTGFREVMLAQHADEPNRKLLETRSWHFTVFLDAGNEVCGFELTDANEEHVLKWRRGQPPAYFRVENLGKGYHNRDELRANGTFHPEAVRAELAVAGRNLRPAIREALLEGIAAYRGDRRTRT